MKKHKKIYGTVKEKRCEFVSEKNRRACKRPAHANVDGIPYCSTHYGRELILKKEVLLRVDIRCYRRLVKVMERALLKSTDPKIKRLLKRIREYNESTKDGAILAAMKKNLWLDFAGVRKKEMDI